MMFLIVGLATFLLSLFFVWLVGIFSYRYGFINQSKGDRWNKKPVALLGGIAIFISFSFGILFLLFAEHTHYFPSPLFLICLGAGIMFLLGLVDDVIKIKPSTKLIGQIIAASIPIAGGLVFALTPWHIVNIVFTFFWFIGIVNAINLIDNMDGLAAGVVAISTLVLIVLRVLGPLNAIHDWIFGVEVVFLYAVAGFWAVNRYPAPIFMGDSGSLFIGYVLAGLAMISTQGDAITTSSTIFSLLLPVVVLTIPIFDTIFVTITRKLRGQPVSVGGRDHSSHLLVGLGFSEERSVYILYGLSIMGGIIAIAIKIWSAYSIPLLVLYVMFLLFIGVYLGKIKISPAPSAPELKNKWTPLLTQIFHKRHLGEVFLDFVLIIVSYYFAYYLRFEGLLNEQADIYIQSLPIVLVACIFGLYFVGAYRGIWHLIALADVIRYGKGILMGAGLSVLLLVVFFRFEGYSRAVFIIFGILLFLFMVGSRLSFRILDDFLKRRISRGQGRGILIYGAGQAGRLLYEESLRNSEYADCNIVGFVDDDVQKQHLTIAGLEIFGQNELTAPSNKKRLPVQELWVSSVKIPKEPIMEFVRRLECLSGRKIEVRRFSMKVDELGRS